MSRSTAVLVGMASLLLLTWATVALRQGPIEADLVQRAEQALSYYAIEGLRITANGRDLTVSGTLPPGAESDSVATIVTDTWGVRTVDASGLRPLPTGQAHRNPLSARFDQTRIRRLGGDLSNPMDAGTCQRTMARLAASSTVLFEAGGASPVIDSYPVLNDLASVAYQCPRTYIVIGGHSDASGDREANLRLSQARAEAIERFFYLAGIPAERMRIVAYGDSQPIASNATAEGRAANRRITFEVFPLD